MRSLIGLIGILAVACGGSGDDVSFGAAGSGGTTGGAAGSSQGGSDQGGAAQGGSSAGGSAAGGSGGASQGGSSVGGGAQGGSAGQGAQGGVAGQAGSAGSNTGGASGGVGGGAGSGGAGSGGAGSGGAGSGGMSGSAGMSAGGTGGGSGTLEGLLMSEYVEGSQANKAIELFNGTGRTLDLSACELVFYFASSTNQAQIPLTGPSGGFAPNHTWVLCDDGGSDGLLKACDQKSDVQFFFNGDDAIELVCDGAVIDSFGRVGEDPGDGWGDPNNVTYTRDHTLRRKCSVSRGDTESGDAFHPATQWDGFGLDQFDGLRSHCGHSTPTSAGQ